MIFGIFIGLALLAVVFFHYVQGFFSSTISAVIAIISAVVAVAYQETLVEGPLAGVAPGWMPALVMLGLFAVTYIVLRTLFDKLVPGQVSLPAALDKVGGAVMGLVAGAFGVGVVVIAAQAMPFGASLGGYTRYETNGTRPADVPGQAGGSAAAGRAKNAATYDEIVGDRYEPEKATKLLGGLAPLDDLVVGAVSHLSDKGSLSAGKPFKETHPDYLQELFGQRLGVQGDASRVLLNSAAKNRTDVEVVAVYRAPETPEAQIVDHEFKMTRGTPVKLTKPQGDEMRVVVRVKFNATAAEKDQKVRISPAQVRLAAKRVNDLTGEPEPFNYYPIATLEPNGTLYAHKVDDFLFIDVPAKKLDGTDGPAEVDFVFQVKQNGFLETPGDKTPEPRIAPGTLLEVKRSARVDLGSGDRAVVKAAAKPLTVLAIKRKNLHWGGGPKPLEPGKGGAAAAAAAAAATPAPAPGGGGGGGGALGQRLVGEWKTGGGITQSEVLTFAADGQMTSSLGGAAPTSMRWTAGAPQGETLTITTEPGGQRTIVFEDENQFSMTDSAGNRRFTRTGSPAAAAPPSAAGASPDEAMSRMVGTWEQGGDVQGDRLSYVFRSDGTYTASRGAQTATGKWRVLRNQGNGAAVRIELTPPTNRVTEQTWNLTGDNPAQIIRTEPAPEMPFNRKS